MMLMMWAGVFMFGGGDMTMVLLDSMILGILVVVLISWVPNMDNMMMIVVILTVRYMLMIICYKGIT